MADNTKIEWADATVNAINGCTRVSPGCGGPGPRGGCYAERLAATRLRNHPSRPGLATMTSAGPRWTGKVHLHEPELLKPLRWQKPRRIFWNAHGDTFHEKVPDEWIDRMFAICALTPQHTHMILTKRPARMRDYLAARDDDYGWRVIDTALDMAEREFGSNWTEHWWSTSPPPFPKPLPNVWLGVSVEDQQAAEERIPDLLATPAAVRFLSCEPLLEAINFQIRNRVEEVTTYPLTGGWVDHQNFNPNGVAAGRGPKIDWVIVGGESGPRARPMHPDWARSIRDQCAAAGVPFFFKQWGEWRDRGGHVLIPTRKSQSHICYLDRNTGRCKPHPNRFSDETMIKLGKKAAGHLLDGNEHHAFPGDAA